MNPNYNQNYTKEDIENLEKIFKELHRERKIKRNCRFIYK